MSVPEETSSSTLLQCDSERTGTVMLQFLSANTLTFWDRALWRIQFKWSNWFIYLYMYTYITCKHIEIVEVIIENCKDECKKIKNPEDCKLENMLFR